MTLPACGAVVLSGRSFRFREGPRSDPQSGAAIKSTFGFRTRVAMRIGWVWVGQDPSGRVLAGPV